LEGLFNRFNGQIAQKVIWQRQAPKRRLVGPF
jgi:hypothetical protein